MRRGKRLTHIHTECGHAYRTAWPASVLRNATADCLVCNALLIFPADIAGAAVRAELFHLHMNRLDPHWPADGADTGYVTF